MQPKTFLLSVLLARRAIQLTRYVNYLYTHLLTLYKFEGVGRIRRLGSSTCLVLSWCVSLPTATSGGGKSFRRRQQRLS